MNDGKDTAYYLYRGYKVVAVEANPGLCKMAAQKFSRELAEGRLALENVAIGEQRGEQTFFVSSVDLLSSLDPSAATRDGQTATAVPVTCVRAADLFARHGVPHFLKVDIEGGDRVCLADLNRDCRPTYLSFEDGPETEEEIPRLVSLGYKRFKLINQSGLLFQSDYEAESAFKKLDRRIHRKFRNLRQGRWYNDWEFECQSSGPFGEDADGRWVSSEELLKIRQRWRELHHRFAKPDKPFWYDVHGAL